jgi:hypothetical protein
MRAAEGLGRRVLRERPVDIHVETQADFIWQGIGAWTGGSIYFEPGLPSDSAPTSFIEFSRWSRTHGGIDVGRSVAVVTVVGRSDATVVIRPPIVSSTSSPVTGGVIVDRPAAGGSMNPRRFDVVLGVLGEPVVNFSDEFTDEPHLQGPPSWFLKCGDCEELHIWVSAEDDQLHAWTLEIPLLVDGRSMNFNVNEGKPFQLVGLNASLGHEIVGN